MSDSQGISVKFAADDRDLIASYARQQERILKNQRALLKMGMMGEQSGRKMKRGADEGAASWGLMTAKVYLAGKAIELVTRGVRQMVQENIKLSKSIDDIANKGAEAELKFQIQGGMTPNQVRGQVPVIHRALSRTPSADLFDAFSISTQLVSSGFNDKDIKSGQALQTVLDLKAATNQFGQEFDDPKQSVQAIAQFLKAQGIANPDAKQIRSTGGRLTTLFEGSDIQFPDLSDLAGQASVLKEKGLSQIEQLAAFSTIRDVKQSPEAATGLRQVVSRLASIGTKPEKLRALGRLGLTGDDVDLSGENFVTALKRLKGGFDSVGTKDRNEIGTIIFGEKGEAAGAALLGAIPTIEKRIQLQESDDAFNRNVKIFQRSRFARQQRAKINEQVELRQLDEDSGSLTYEESRQLLRAKMAKLQRQTRAQGGLRGVVGGAALGGITAVGEMAISGYEAVGARPSDIGMVDPTKVPKDLRDRIGNETADNIESILHTAAESQRERAMAPVKVEVVNDPVKDRGKVPRRPPAANNSR